MTKPPHIERGRRKINRSERMDPPERENLIDKTLWTETIQFFRFGWNLTEFSMDVWCCSPSTTIIVYNGKYNWFVELPNAFSPKEFLFCRFFYLMLLLFYHFFCLKRFSPISPVQPLHFMFHPTATCITRVMLRWEAPFTEEAVDGKI